MVYKGEDDRYFEWLKGLITNPHNNNLIIKNHLVLSILYNRPFLVHPSVPMDKNRMYDGLELRENFIQETGRYRHKFISDECSVLEMIVALSIRCEETIMGDNISNNSYKWFWKMLEMMGIKDSHDEMFIQSRIDNLINRTYDYDGRNGCLFIINSPRKRLPEVEIWYQMAWYLNNIM